MWHSIGSISIRIIFAQSSRYKKSLASVLIEGIILSIAITFYNSPNFLISLYNNRNILLLSIARVIKSLSADNVLGALLSNSSTVSGSRLYISSSLLSSIEIQTCLIRSKYRISSWDNMLVLRIPKELYLFYHIWAIYTGIKYLSEKIPKDRQTVLEIWSPYIKLASSLWLWGHSPRPSTVTLSSS
jgi:hypothetical protein